MFYLLCCVILCFLVCGSIQGERNKEMKIYVKKKKKNKEAKWPMAN